MSKPTLKVRRLAEDVEVYEAILEGGDAGERELIHFWSTGESEGGEIPRFARRAQKNMNTGGLLLASGKHLKIFS